MLEFNDMLQMHNNMFTVVSIFIGAVFILVIILIISPKIRGKLMSHQIKSLKHMTNYSKEDIKEISTNMQNIAINIKKQVLDENEDLLKDISAREAQIEREGLKVKLNTVRDELLTDRNFFCKHCGQSIPNDSKFCKYCGKKQ